MNQSYSFRWLVASSTKVNIQRLLLIAIATFSLIAFIPNPYRNEFADLTEGSVANIEVIAPFDFEILKDPEELSQERYNARENTPPLIEYRDSISKLIRSKSQNVFNFLRTEIPKIARKSENQKADAIDDLFQTLWSGYHFYVHKDNLWWLLKKYTENEKSVIDAFERWNHLIEKIVNQGIVEIPENITNQKVTTLKDGIATIQDRTLLITKEQLAQELLDLLREQEPSEEFIRVGYDFIRPLLQPNWYFNLSATQALQDAAAAAIPSAQGIVLKGEKIVDRGKRIDKSTIQILKSLQMKHAERLAAQGFWGRLLPKVGQAIVVFLFLLFWIVILLTIQHEKVQRFQDLVLAILLVVLPEMLLVYVITLNNLSVFLFPIAAFVITISVLYNLETALISTIIFAGLSGVLGDGSISLMLFTLLSGVVSLFFGRSITSRSQLFRAIPAIFAVTAILVGVKALTDFQWSPLYTRDLVAGLITSVASPLIAFGLVVGAEKIFRLTTDLTYIELADFNRPILRKLALEAPGTFHHSVLVGALSESAARAINANPILVRCAAYYHDIGKLDLHNYFVENQIGIENPHNQISPLESATILRKHVSIGIEKARELNLPEEIIAGIPEHHGTSVMRYFYQKALVTSSNEVNEKQFRYNGPKPKSKETAILMLADGCEAISRTLKNPSRSEIRKAVHEIIHEKMVDGQLENSPITFADLKRIETAFVTVLDGIMHKRIVYPKSVNKIGEKE